jgi:hypothetical protein
MPWFFDVAVQSEAHFGTDEPKLFRPIAHSGEQALRQVLSHIWMASPEVELENIATTTTRGKRIGGYDDPGVQYRMMSQSGVTGR